MAEGLLARETIANYGEFRAYLRRERQELAFEAFREDDGRAWLLRVPIGARPAIVGLLREIGPILEAGRRPAVDETGIVRRVALGPADQLAAVLLEDGELSAFALWRQEQLRAGWSWTVDVVVVPLALAGRLCGLALQVLDRVAAAEPEASRGTVADRAVTDKALRKLASPTGIEPVFQP
jgi:hypothetical protein